MNDVLLTPPAARAARQAPLLPNLDYRLLAAIAAVALLGLVMMASASVSIADRAFGDPLFYFKRQALYLTFGLVLAAPLLWIPLSYLQRLRWPLLGLAYLLLVLVLLIGREVNGAVRWISLGFINLQVSEVAKLLIFVYLAGYLVRQEAAVRQTWQAFLVPVGLMLAAAVLLLAEPDFGAAAVMVATGMGMLFLAGVPLGRFVVLGVPVVAAGVALVLTSPYRVARLTAFLNPWADPFDSGFQLTQSLIAIGRGEWFGVGLGGSVQKLFYLPEAHTDFLFAVLAEELGLMGVAVTVLLYAYIVWRAFDVGNRSLRSGLHMGAYIAYATGLWLGLQVFVNMGVNMGLLPTKGLTLPLMSYGGSSVLMTLASLALLVRADHELRVASVAARPTRGRRA